MDVYRELGIEQIINAAGTLTTLGGSLMLLGCAPRVAVQRIIASSEERGLAPGDEIRIHPHTLRESEEVIVAERIREILCQGES